MTALPNIREALVHLNNAVRADAAGDITNATSHALMAIAALVTVVQRQHEMITRLTLRVDVKGEG